MIERLARWIDRRVGGPEFVQDKLTKVFPESWTFLFGEIALYAFVVLVLTGTFLALFYNGSLTETTYAGSYEPLQGLEMSAAYESVIRISFDVRAGLLIRQMHHWAANIFIAAIVVHLLRVFFTGAFRKPRELNWMIGVTLLLLGILEGFAGYSLVDDVLSGIGLRIGYSIMESVPVVGSWLASFLFGGMFPGDQIIGRLFGLHIWVLPAAMGALVAVHLALIVRQIHTQYPGESRTEDNVVGVRMYPTYTAMSVGLFCLTFAVIAALGGLVQINPVWLWGPYDPYLVSIGAQPDWYMGWLEGALRIFPPWEFTGWGYMIPNPFFPAVLLPGLTFLGLYLYPFVEQRLTGDLRQHQLLDRPRHRPVRTAFGVGMVTFYVVLTIAGSQDIIAFQLNIAITGLAWFLRVAVIVLPLITGFIAYRWCRDLAASEHPPAGAHVHSEADAGDDGDERPGPRGRGRRPRRWGWIGATLAAVGGYLVGRDPERDLPEVLK